MVKIRYLYFGSLKFYFAKLSEILRFSLSISITTKSLRSFKVNTFSGSISLPLPSSETWTKASTAGLICTKAPKGVILVTVPSTLLPFLSFST